MTDKQNREREAAEQLLAQSADIERRLADGVTDRFDRIVDAALASAWGEAMVLHRAEEILATQRAAEINWARRVLGMQQTDTSMRIREELPFKPLAKAMYREAADRASIALDEWRQQVQAYVNGERDTLPDYPDFAT